MYGVSDSVVLSPTRIYTIHVLLDYLGFHSINEIDVDINVNISTSI